MKHLRNYILLLIISCGQILNAQITDSSFVIYGQVLNDKTGAPISNAHIVNKRNFVGTVSNAQGYFYIDLVYGDSIVVSSLGYDFYYYTTNIKPVGVVRMRMKERIYYLNQVTLSNYKLTSNDPKEMKMGEPMIPKTSDIRYPSPVNPTLANPIDLLYHMFSSKTRQLNILRELQAKDAYKVKLESGNNREVLSNLTGLSKEELEEFLFFCKYSAVQISTMNDYALLMTLMQCYDEFLRIQEKEKILSEYEQGEKAPSERFE